MRVTTILAGRHLIFIGTNALPSLSTPSSESPEFTQHPPHVLVLLAPPCGALMVVVVWDISTYPIHPISGLIWDFYCEFAENIRQKMGGWQKTTLFTGFFLHPSLSRIIKENNYIKPWPNCKHRPLDIWALLLTHRWHSRTGDKRTAASLSRKICRGLNVSWEPLPLRAVRERVIWRRLSILNGQAGRERCGIPTRERSGDLTYYSRRQCFFFLWFLLKTARQEANARKGMFIYYVTAERGGGSTGFITI